MRVKKKEVLENKIEFDETEYKIIREPYKKFHAKFYKLFWGDLGVCIDEFEDKYGKIDGHIYYDETKKLVGITGSQIINQIRR